MIGALAIKNRRQQQLLKSKSVTSNAEPNAGRDSRPEPVPEPPKPRHCSLIYIISGCLFITGFVLIIPGMVHMKSSLFITSAVLMVGGLGIAFLACGLSDYWYGSISGEHVEGGRAALNEMRKRMNMPPLPSSKKEFAKRSSDKAQAIRQSKNGRQEQPLEQQRRAAAAGDTAPVAAVTKTGDQEAASGNNNNITSELSPRSMTPDLIRSSSPKGDRECHIVTGIEKAASGLAVSAAARGVEGGGGFSSKQSSVSISEVNATTVSSSSSPPPRSSSLASAVSVTNLHQDLEASIAAHSDLPLVST